MSENIAPPIVSETIQEVLSKAYSYSEYRSLIDGLLAESKTTGENHSEEYLHYSNLNVQRMSRLDRTTKLDEALIENISNISEKQTWLILTEAWCGDAAQNIPVIQKMAELNENIEVKLILRDENLEIMDAYLTNGGRSIPKLIAFNLETQEELFTWGPRPQNAQELFMDFKTNPNGRTYADFSIEMQKWYAKDRTKSLQDEFVELLR
jgi:hypothetical protein